MNKEKIAKLNQFITASENTRIKILGACYRNKLLKILNRSFTEDELKAITGSRDSDMLLEHIRILESSGLVSIETKDMPKMSEHILVDITEEGIHILNELGITEDIIKAEG